MLPIELMIRVNSIFRNDIIKLNSIIIAVDNHNFDYLTIQNHYINCFLSWYDLHQLKYIKYMDKSSKRLVKKFNQCYTTFIYISITVMTSVRSQIFSFRNSFLCRMWKRGGPGWHLFDLLCFFV